jgi:hypothetical protein
VSWCCDITLKLYWIDIGLFCSPLFVLQISV